MFQMNHELENRIHLFEDRRIRTAWDEEMEEWYFSIVDVIGVLTEQPDYDGARNYWKVLKSVVFSGFAVNFFDRKFLFGAYTEDGC